MQPGKKGLSLPGRRRKGFTNHSPPAGAPDPAAWSVPSHRLPGSLAFLVERTLLEWGAAPDVVGFDAIDALLALETQQATEVLATLRVDMNALPREARTQERVTTRIVELAKSMPGYTNPASRTVFIPNTPLDEGATRPPNADSDLPSFIYPALPVLLELTADCGPVLKYAIRQAPVHGWHGFFEFVTTGGYQNALELRTLCGRPVRICPTKSGPIVKGCTLGANARRYLDMRCLGPVAALPRQLPGTRGPERPHPAQQRPGGEPAGPGGQAAEVEQAVQRLSPPRPCGVAAQCAGVRQENTPLPHSLLFGADQGPCWFFRKRRSPEGPLPRASGPYEWSKLADWVQSGRLQTGGNEASHALAPGVWWDLSVVVRSARDHLPLYLPAGVQIIQLQGARGQPQAASSVQVPPHRGGGQAGPAQGAPPGAAVPQCPLPPEFRAGAAAARTAAAAVRTAAPTRLQQCPPGAAATPPQPLSAATAPVRPQLALPAAAAAPPQPQPGGPAPAGPPLLPVPHQPLLSPSAGQQRPQAPAPGRAQRGAAAAAGPTFLDDDGLLALLRDVLAGQVGNDLQPAADGSAEAVAGLPAPAHRGGPSGPHNTDWR
eukprot:TRINITY_DN34461_c0_g1_i1.p1 TRINITY_DN34461_c0_g1~~TRINITY_DN34461_c0_g1_i1.p1  ORF type:complete len:627 (+),score=97.14 TRINITY_DN34461_c0_g1_i1:74-1882(+)